MRGIKGAAVLITGLLAISGCGKGQPGTAAVLDGYTITNAQVYDLTSASGWINEKGIASPTTALLALLAGKTYIDIYEKEGIYVSREEVTKYLRNSIAQQQAKSKASGQLNSPLMKIDVNNFYPSPGVELFFRAMLEQQAWVEKTKGQPLNAGDMLSKKLENGQITINPRYIQFDASGNAVKSFAWIVKRSQPQIQN